MMLTNSRTLTTFFAATAVAATNFAASAHADPSPLNGTYTGAGGTAEFLWTISSNCGATGCTAHVASSQGWTSVATLTDGRWNFTVTKPDGVICDDGRYEPAVVAMSIDPVTLSGVISSDSNFGCPGGHLSATPFALKKVG
jgi:hypothetical protein